MQRSFIYFAAFTGKRVQRVTWHGHGQLGEPPLTSRVFGTLA